MSEVQSRPSTSRGRGSHRGGRGGYRGGRGASKNSKSDIENQPPTIEDQGEIGALKKKHGSKVSTVRELFPDWTEEDVVYALEETGGDLESTVERITIGSIGQWGEVAKKSDRSRSKVKDSHSSHDAASGARGSRGRGGFESRPRGRGADRGRSGRGGRANSQSNGTRASDKPSKPVQDGWGDNETLVPAAVEASGSWADDATNGDRVTGDPIENVEIPKESIAKADGPISHGIPSSKVSGWAGLFAKPAPEPIPKRAAAPPPTSIEEVSEPTVDSMAITPTQPPVVETPIDSISSDIVDSIPSDPALTLTPSKDELTHDNLEHIPDISQPIASATAASTVASTQDPHSNLNSAQPTIRPGMSGYATSALKATAVSGRTSSFQRRVLEQQEAVVMPENRAVSRAALQFGSMNINGSVGDAGPEEDREEPETRTQLPDDSPVAPRASLPPSAAVAPPQAPAEPPTAPKAAPGLPPVPIQQQQQSASPPQASAYADQFARYGQASQKAYDAFGQQSNQQPPPPQQAPTVAQDAVSSQSASQGQTSSTSGPSEYAAYYGQDAQRNLAYQNFYGYTQNQEAQQRSGSAFGNLAESQPQYATSRPQAGVAQQEAQHSGHNTPNPPQQSNQQHQQQPQNMHQGQGSHAGYPYGYANAGYNQPYPQYASYMNQMNQHQYGQSRPMFDDARRYDEQYMSHNNQYSGSYGRQYSGSHYNKSGMYNQPQHQYSYEQSSSPATAPGLNQTAGREGSYGRTGSTQPSESQQAGSGNAFGAINDPFSRDQSGFGGHTPMSQQHPGQIGLDDNAKSYDASKTGGPSPPMKNAHRPASAANNNMQAHQQAGAQQSTGFPGSTQSQQGTSQQQQHANFSAYPQYGGFGANIGGGGHHGQHHQQQQGVGAGGQGNHPAQSTQQQQYQYGGASAAGFGNYSAAGYGSGRGWSGSYGAGH